MDLIRIDIEGAEDQIVWSSNEWLGKVGAIILKIHPITTPEKIFAYIKDYGFSVRRHGSGHEPVFLLAKLVERIMNWIRALKNLPLRFHEEQSDQLAAVCPEGWRRVYLSRKAYVVCPADALVVSIWRFQTFCRGGRNEFFDFLDLAEECRSFLDLGASAGIFSALFANTRHGAEIVSVEPDRRSFDLLLETANLNQANSHDWRTVRVAVSNQKGSIRFHSDGFGGTISHDVTDEEVRAHTLESLADELGWIPDVIKIDIESYEYEVLEAAVEWLKLHRPRLFLELHWSLLEARGHSPARLLDLLNSIGYRWRGRELSLRSVRSRLDGAGCSRLALTSAS